MYDEINYIVEIRLKPLAFNNISNINENSNLNNTVATTNIILLPTLKPELMPALTTPLMKTLTTTLMATYIKTLATTVITTLFSSMIST